MLVVTADHILELAVAGVPLDLEFFGERRLLDVGKAFRRIQAHPGERQAPECRVGVGGRYDVVVIADVQAL